MSAQHPNVFQKDKLRKKESKFKKKMKNAASTVKSNAADNFAQAKHKGLLAVKEAQSMTFKQYLVEMSQKEKEALIPPVAIQKLYNDLKRQHGIVKRDVFLNKLADRFNLTPEGMQRLMTLPSIRSLPFDDVQGGPNIPPGDPWAHVSQKAQRREDRAKEAGINW